MRRDTETHLTHSLDANKTKTRKRGKDRVPSIGKVNRDRTVPGKGNTFIASNNINNIIIIIIHINIKIKMNRSNRQLIRTNETKTTRRDTTSQCNDNDK